MINKTTMIEMLDAYLGYDCTRIKQLNRIMASWDARKKQLITLSYGKNTETLKGAIGDCEDINFVNNTILIADMNYKYEIVNRRRTRVSYLSNWVIEFSGSPVDDFYMVSKFVYGPMKKTFLENLDSIKKQSNWSTIKAKFSINDDDDDYLVAEKLATQYRIWWYDMPEFSENDVDLQIIHGPAEGGYKIEGQLFIKGMKITAQTPALFVTPMNNDIRFRKFGAQENKSNVLLQTDLRIRGRQFIHIRDPRDMMIFFKCSYKEPNSGIVRYISKTIENVPVQNTLSPFNYRGNKF